MKKLLTLFIVFQLHGFMPNNGWIGSQDAQLRVSNYPFISGDTFRSFADHIYDETNVDGFDPAAVQSGDSVFLNTMLLFFFKAHVHPLIAHPYILLCHNSDMAVPDYHVDLLEDPKIIAWFSPNIMIPNHPKLHVIPLGINNGMYNQTTVLAHAVDLAGIFTKPLKAYLNFKEGSNPLLRGQVRQLFSANPLCMIAQDRTYSDYLADMKSCAFVISPAGFGIDCYRHWEALYVGSIPIMKHSTIDAVFDDLPVILVDDWSMASTPVILHEYEKLKNKKINYKKLTAEYWFDTIRMVQKQYRESINA